MPILNPFELPRPEELEDRFFLGVDLGQANDNTAIAAIQLMPPTPQGQGKAPPPRYQLRHLERPALGTPYPDIVKRVKALMGAPGLAGHTTLVVDGTGVGRAVVDMFRAEGLKPVSITITGGTSVTFPGGGYGVPKRDLAGILQATLQGGRLHVASGLTEARTLVSELLAFKVKVNLETGHDSYEAWRDQDHDDVVLAVAIALWYAERRGRPQKARNVSALTGKRIG